MEKIGIFYLVVFPIETKKIQLPRAYICCHCGENSSQNQEYAHCLVVMYSFHEYRRFKIDNKMGSIQKGLQNL